METDRRKSFRIPLTPDHGRMVTFFPIGFTGRVKSGVTGVIDNISEEGLGGIVHAKTRKRKKWWVSFNFPGPLRGTRVLCQVRRAEKDNHGTQVGMKFLTVAPEVVAVIKKMTYGYRVCEAGIAFAMQNVCDRKCAFYLLCRKPIKLREI